MSALVRVLFGLLIAVPGTVLAQPPAAQEQPQARLTVMRLGSFSPQRAFSESAEGKAGLALQLVVNLDENALVWADPLLDITADVVKQLARADIPRHP